MTIKTRINRFCEMRQAFNHTQTFSAEDKWGRVSSHTHRGLENHRGHCKLPDGFDHAEAHFNAAMGVVLAGLRQSRHAVVAVPQDFNAKTMMLLRETEQQGKDHVIKRTRLSESSRKDASDVECLQITVSNTGL